MILYFQFSPGWLNIRLWCVCCACPCMYICDAVTSCNVTMLHTLIRVSPRDLFGFQPCGCVCVCVCVAILLLNSVMLLLSISAALFLFCVYVHVLKEKEKVS